VKLTTYLHMGPRLTMSGVATYSCASPIRLYDVEGNNYKFDVRGSVHHSTNLTVKNPTGCNSVIKILLSLILNKAQHVSGYTPPIIRSLKLHNQPLVMHNAVEGRRTYSCWTLSGSVCCLTTPSNCTSDNFPRHYA